MIYLIKRSFMILLFMLLITVGNNTSYKLQIASENDSEIAENSQSYDNFVEFKDFQFSSDTNNFKVNHGEQITVEMTSDLSSFTLSKSDIGAEVRKGEIADANIEVLQINGEEKGSESYKNESVIVEYKFTCKELGENEIALTDKRNSGKAMVTIYAYCSEKFDYISLDSMSSVKGVYYSDTFEVNEGVTYQSFVFGDDFIETQDICYNQLSYDRIAIKGYVTFEDQDSIVNPAQGVKVEIWEDGLIDVKLDTVHTDINGYYYYERDNNRLERYLDLYIIVRFDTDEFNVTTISQSTNYSFTSTTENNMMGGSIAERGVQFVYGENNDRTAAMHQHQAMIVGFKYLNFIDYSSSYDNLTVFYPTYDGSLYDPITNTIYSDLENGYDWDTVTHEFGHFADDQMNLFDWLGSEHWLDKNLMDEFMIRKLMGEFPFITYDPKSRGAEVALGEGFATYFGIMAQEYAAAHYSIYQVADLKFRNYSIESHDLHRFGEGGEWGISRLLYDLQDSSQEDWDEVDISQQKVIGLLKDANGSSGATNFSQFWDEVEDYITWCDTGKLLEYYKFSPAPTNLYENTTASYYPMTITWVNEGGSVYYPNENPLITVMDNNMNIIETIQLYGSSSYMAYTFTYDKWENILNNTIGYFYVTISASQTDNPSTGPYTSGKYKINLPELRTIFAYTNYYGEIEYSNDFEWFEFVAPASDTYTFYTTGSTDTYGEFFYALVPGLSVSGRVGYDDNNGTGDNFSKSIYLTTGQKIFIRVRGSSSSDTGEYVLRVIKQGSC